MNFEARFMPSPIDPTIGYVEIQYEDGVAESFSSVPRGKYFRWVASDFDLDLMPLQVELRPDDEEDELEISVHPDDHIGQLTGMPTPGFEQPFVSAKVEIFFEDEDDFSDLFPAAQFLGDGI